ncbi:tRNA pseudouridine(38/39) synthase, partial [Dryobates pubescens]
MAEGSTAPDPEQLLRRVQELEEEVKRLQEKLQEDSRGGEAAAGPGRGRKRQQRPFDFGAHGRRRVALKIAYLGWGYQGFASQENTSNTVEEKLFEALKKTRLVDSRQTSNYHRCGRTDKGVSAFGQVSSPRGPAASGEAGPGEPCRRGLPRAEQRGRILSPALATLFWMQPRLPLASCTASAHCWLLPSCSPPAPPRPSLQGCSHSPPPQPGLLPRVALTQGQDLALGLIEPPEVLSAQLCSLSLTLYLGASFSILEPIFPTLVLIFDISPKFPSYMAVEFPLVLYNCEFENLQWLYDRDVQEFNVTHLQQLWASHAVKTQVLRDMLQGLEAAPVPADDSPGSSTTIPWGELKPPLQSQASSFMEGVRARTYKPLLARPKCEGLESRIRHFVRRGRIETP